MMNKLVLLILSLCCLQAFGENGREPGRAVSPGEVDSLLNKLQRKEFEEIKNKYIPLMQDHLKKGDSSIMCWLEFIEAGGLDMMAFNYQDLLDMDIHNLAKTQKNDNGISAVLEFKDKSIASPTQPLKELYIVEKHKGSIAQVDSLSWKLSMLFDKQTNKLVSWNLSFSAASGNSVDRVRLRQEHK